MNNFYHFLPFNAVLILLVVQELKYKDNNLSLQISQNFCRINCMELLLRENP